MTLYSSLVARPIHAGSRFPAGFLLAFTSVLFFANTVQAGTVSSDNSGKRFNVAISDSETASSWILDLSGFLGFDSNTGALSMPAQGTTLGANCEWTTVQVYNPTTSSFESKSAIKWWTPETTTDGLWRSTFTFYATGNVDPFLSYAFSAKNNTTSSQTYHFSLGEALIPTITGQADLYADVAGSLTNAVAGTTAKMTPTAGALQVLKLSSDGGLTFANAGVDVGTGLETGTAAGTTPYGVYSASINDIAATNWDYWQIDTHFTLSPGKDAFAVSGYAELNATANIPEPSTTAAIMGSAVLAAAFALRKRRRVQALA